MKCYIYALVDPRDYRVRYVGKTSKPVQERLRHHVQAAARGSSKPVYQWLRTVQPQQPVLIILQELSISPLDARFRKQGRYISTGAAAEVKWIKRFRRDCLNDLDKDSACLAWKSLLNPDEESEG